MTIAQIHPGVSVHIDSEVEARLRGSEKEPETAEWLERLIGTGDVLYDVGACIGSYSLLAASLEARTIAFEPSALNMSQLVRNIVLNDQAARITPLPIALGQETTIRYLHFSSDQAGAASHELNGWPADDAQAIMVWSLDELVRTFVLPLPTLLKVDTDGGEVAVLRGARNLLGLIQLRSVMVEVSEESDDMVAGLLHDEGFTEIKRTQRLGHVAVWNVEYQRGE